MASSTALRSGREAAAVGVALAVLLATCAGLPPVVAAPTGAGASSDGRPFAVAAYLPEWRYEGANWDVIARHTSHLILFSLEVTEQGGIKERGRLPRPELLRQALAAAERHGTAVLVCFGGNGRSRGFRRMVARAPRRKRFVRALRKLLKETGLHGVDYNWEYPGYEMGSGYLSDEQVAADYAGLLELLADTRSVLGSDAVITMAYYPDGRQEALLRDTAGGAARYVDLMHMMSYDQGGQHHSSLAFGKSTAEQGARLLPAAQVTAGLPFYGRFTTTGDWRSYEDIVQAHWPLDPGLDAVRSPDDRGAAASLGFNGVRTIEERTVHAIQLGLGGVMIWEVGQDCRLEPVTHGDTTHVRTCPGSGDDASLLAAIARAMRASGARLPQFVARGRARDAEL